MASVPLALVALFRPIGPCEVVGAACHGTKLLLLVVGDGGGGVPAACWRVGMGWVATQWETCLRVGMPVCRPVCLAMLQGGDGQG